MSTFTFRTLAIRVSTPRLAASIAMLCAVLLLAPNPVSAAAISIDDTSPAEVITISANDFEFGFSVNGAQIQVGLNNPGSITVPETGTVTFDGTWIAPGGDGTVVRTIYLVESPPSATSPPLVSDILRYTATFTGSLGTIQGTFVSDVNDNLGTLPAGVDPADVFVEDGKPVFFDLPFLTGSIISDVNIPEPSSLVLLGLGLVSLVGYRLRKRLA